MNEGREGRGPGGEGEQVVQQKFQGQAVGRVASDWVVEESRSLQMKVLRAAPQAM
jgi:hypothetical protein